VKKIVLGDVEVSRVVEWQGAFATTDVLFPSVPGELWRRHESWLAPDFLDPTTGAWQATVQTWVLRSEGRTILVDTGLGNDKQREVSSTVWRRPGCGRRTWISSSTPTCTTTTWGGTPGWSTASGCRRSPTRGI
jgi:hypothetical protein